MKHLHLRNILCVVLAFLLAAAVLGLVGCKNSPDTAPTEAGDVISFTFEVTGSDGVTQTQTVTTNCTTVGDALLDAGLVEGEDGPYGLYITTVLGETHVYETDGHYWAFYIDGEYAMNGVDETEIVPGSVYALCVE